MIAFSTNFAIASGFSPPEVSVCGMPGRSAAPRKELPDALLAPIGFGPPALPATALDAEAGPHAFAGGDFVTVTVTLAELEDEFVATADTLSAIA